jgi:hypothetical protein
MTAKEKALELYSTYETYVRFNMEDCSFTYRDVNYTFTFAVNKTAKQCALIAVGEMKKTLLMVYNGVDNIPHLVTAYKSEKDYNDNVKNIRDVLKHDLAKEIMWLSDVKTEIEKL